MRNRFLFALAVFGVALSAMLSGIQPAAAQYRVVATCPGPTDIQPAGSSGGSPAVDTKGNLCTLNSSGGSGGTVTPTTRGTTITLGGQAQNLMPANTSRHGCEWQNVSVGDIWYSTTTTAVLASPSFRLSPGSYFSCMINGIPATEVSIIGATTGQAVSAQEW